ncbi:MAG: response regulator [Planctomycetota bacterium]
MNAQTGSTQAVPIAVIDDDDAHVELLRLALAELEDLPTALSAYHDPDEALDALADDPAKIVFLDYRFPGRSGLEVLRAIRGRGDLRPVVVLTSQGDEYVAAEMTRAGADDYVSKSDLKPEFIGPVVRRMLALAEREADVRQARGEVVANLATLTPRESEVLDFIISGMTTREIAETLHRSEKTIKIHRGNLMSKMRASTAGDLVRMAVQAGRTGAGTGA